MATSLGQEAPTRLHYSSWVIFPLVSFACVHGSIPQLPPLSSLPPARLEMVGLRHLPSRSFLQRPGCPPAVLATDAPYIDSSVTMPPSFYVVEHKLSCPQRGADPLPSYETKRR
jgi:hypothetical protein